MSSKQSTFFPPDLARGGIDLESLVVVLADSSNQIAPVGARLVRSGAFGLVVMDLGGAGHLPTPLQGRLTKLAIHYDTAVLLLTEKTAAAASVGSMVSLRTETARKALGQGRFEIHFTILKDKRNGPGWHHVKVVDGPAGLC